MLSVLFYSHLLAIAKEQIHFIFILLFYTWRYKQISSRKSNQSRKQYPVYNLDGVARNDIPCFRQRGQKQYPAVYRHLPV